MSHTIIISLLTSVGSNGLELRGLVRYSRSQGALLYRRQGKQIHVTDLQTFRTRRYRVFI